MTRSTLLLLVVLLLTTTAKLYAQRQPTDPERAAVQAVIVKMGEQIQTGDFAALDSIFPARGIHILTDTLTLHGWPEYRDRHLKPELARFTNLQFRHTNVEAQVRGTVAWVAFRQMFDGAVEGGTSRINGRATAVLEKRGDRWIIVHLHVSR